MTYERIRPLPPDFTDAEAASVESLRDAWTDQHAGLAENGALTEFNDRLIRRWSIETGIIERLYSLDRGTTEILVNKGLDAALIEHNASDLPPMELVAILEDHRDAATYVTDHVAEGRGLTTAFIKSLHALLTRHQFTVSGVDQFNQPVEYNLIHGDWKTSPNNPRRPDGITHEYCPPILVAEEMDTLISNYNKLEAPTLIKASWLHHRFTQIHPFQDGNGRTARAITSFVLITQGCFPIVVDRDNRSTYIEALERADAGDLLPLVRLFARLEKKELEHALSLSADALSSASLRPELPLRQRLLTALRDRAKDRREAISNARNEIIDVGKRIFDVEILNAVRDLADDVRSLLQVELPGSDVRVERSTPSTRHYFKSQLVDIAQQEGYYGDFSAVHEWCRLRIQRPGESDESVSEVVISMHSLGRQFSGVMVIAAYFATRFLDEDGRSLTLKPHRLAERSLSFSYRENESDVSSRIEAWIEGALDMSLAELQESL